MARSPSPPPKRRRGEYDEASPRHDRDRRSDRNDRDRDSSRRESGSSRRKYDSRDSGRSHSRRDSERNNERERGNDRERERGGERSDRDSRRGEGGERERYESHSRRDYSRSRSPERRHDSRHSRPRSTTPADRRALTPTLPASGSKLAKNAFLPLSAAAPTTPSSASPSHRADSPAEGAGTSALGPAEEEKLRLKREKLEAWKRDREAKKAAGATASPGPPAASPAKVATPPLAPPKPLAYTSTTPVVSSATTPSSSSLPAKPTFSFTNTASSFKPSNLKNSLSFGNNEEEAVVSVGMVKFDAIDEADLKVGGEDWDEDDEEDLDAGASYKVRETGGKEVDVEMAEGEEAAQPLEVKMEVEPTPAEVVSIATPIDEDEEEVDELEAFMSGVTKQVKNVDESDRAKLLSSASGKKAAPVEGEEVEEEDKVESEDEIDKVGMKAEDILALAAKKIKRGRELAPVNHSLVNYEPFRKAFYHPPPEVELLTPEEVEEMRSEMDGIKVRGAEPPKPVSKWSYCGLPATCIEVIKGLEYAAPTSIQAQAIPAIMSGRDIIGVAKTGSGKTIAFLLPMFRHIKDQRPLRSLEGPIAMIMTPTRELATQIHRECKPFLKAMGLRASCAYGGTPLKDNIADMKRGAEVVVCTPGRMIELLTTNSGRIINLQRITYLVLDEADRMFDMGFEPQVMKIINQVRPDRQTVLFSATFPRQMEALARKILRRPLEITVGGRSIVAPEITQIVEVREEETKFHRLLELLGRLSNEDTDARALIFVERQEGADNLLKELLKKNYSCMSLHGGMEQVDRDQTIADFKTGVVPIVIATSVAARGLDVKQLKLVVQYDAPNHMEDYVHRAGRTGRAGNKGTCVTFVTKEQDRYALDIYKALTASGADIPADFKTLAESFAEKVKAGKASGAGSGFGGKGLERLDQERDASSRAERAAYGEVPGAEVKIVDATATTAAGAEGPSLLDPAELEVEIRRGPAPDSIRKGSGVESDSSMASLKAAEKAALAAGKPIAGITKAQSVIANFNAMLKAKTRAGGAGDDNYATDSARRRDPDATDFHAIIYINDYPQKARWKVTNKETMVLLVESTGASITNKGVFYEPGKEPGPDDLPKLHFLIESNDEFRVKHAIQEIKRSLIEGATAALEAEQRMPGGGGAAPGRYSVV